MSWKLAPGVSFVEADGGAVLLDGGSGTYWQVNGTGALVLKALMETGSAEAAAEKLRSSFPESGADHETDVRVLVEKAESTGLVTHES